MRIKKQQQGFSLLELVIVIIIVIILFVAGVERFRRYAPAAERAAFVGMLANYQGAINMAMATALIENKSDALLTWAGTNPMRFLSVTPANYVGEVDNANFESLPKRSWVFDKSKSELVYLVDYTQGVTVQGVAADTLHFKVEMAYSADVVDPQKTILQAVVLKPVLPYEWVSGF